jgi:hypothetical protein
MVGIANHRWPPQSPQTGTNASSQPADLRTKKIVIVTCARDSIVAGAESGEYCQFVAEFPPDGGAWRRPFWLPSSALQTQGRHFANSQLNQTKETRFVHWGTVTRFR